MGFPDDSDGKASVCNAGDPGSIPGSGRSPGEGNGNPLLPGKSHGQRSLVGYSPWGQKELEVTEGLYFSLFYYSRYMSNCDHVNFVVVYLFWRHGSVCNYNE